MDGNLENFDVDATLSAIESPSTERPMSAPPEQTQQTQTPTPQEFEFNWNGRQIKAPLDKITKFASQGYDYSQKMAEFKRQQQEFETQRQALNPFQEVDAYARANPDWWNHVRSSYESRAQQQAAQSQPAEGDLTQFIDPLKSDLNEIKEWKNSVEQERIAYQRNQEDQQLEGEIKSIRESYKDLDFDRVDEEGLTLETKVLKHAVDNGIKNFKTAFRDYMADELVKRAEARGRELAVKERQEHAKRGLLGKTQAPTNGLKPAQNYRQKSYQDLTNEALDELGIPHN
jgi:hypothetical protein